jgi:hypothetical protein
LFVKIEFMFYNRVYCYEKQGLLYFLEEKLKGFIFYCTGIINAFSVVFPLGDFSRFELLRTP